MYALKGSTLLHTLNLSECELLERVDVPTGLATLKTLDLTGSTSLQNVDGVRSALPLSKIISADGTISVSRAEWGPAPNLWQGHGSGRFAMALVPRMSVCHCDPRLTAP